MSRKSHKGADHEEHADESWLIPYADLLTLLLALFIVLFASSSIDEAKYGALQEVFFEAFNGQVPTVPDNTNPDDWIPSLVIPGETPPGEGDGEGDGEGGLGSLYDSMLQYIELNGLEETVVVEYQGENVLITLKNDIWFESGSAVLSEVMREKAVVLGQILVENQDESKPFDIIVAGHTDNDPINTAQYQDNLDLSFDRAGEFYRYLIKTTGLNPEHMSARGYGEEKPIASNDTEEGKALNRRVELLVSQPVEAILPQDQE